MTYYSNNPEPGDRHETSTESIRYTARDRKEVVHPMDKWIERGVIAAIVVTLGILLAFVSHIAYGQDVQDIPAWATPVVAAVTINPEFVNETLLALEADVTAGDVSLPVYDGMTFDSADAQTSYSLARVGAIRQVFANLRSPDRRVRVAPYAADCLGLIDGTMGSVFTPEREVVVNYVVTKAKAACLQQAAVLQAIGSSLETYQDPNNL